MPKQSVHLFGIRHHGPGSARSLNAALERLNPDMILIEGPPEATGALPLAIHAQMQPPVALLVYNPERMEQMGYFPFAAFSPEWNALQFALQRQIVVRFIDMLITHRLALMDTATQASARPPTATDSPPPEGGEEYLLRQENAPTLQSDPLYWLAQAAGFSDGERWWDHLVESRRKLNSEDDIFAAILTAITTLRAANPTPFDDLTPRREAFMRRAVRAARLEGYRRIAVVCGAWHTPALAALPPAEDDEALFADLPRVPVEVVWTPWTHGRLVRSIYGAGVAAPGWYAHLWQYHNSDEAAVGWITKVARHLRKEGLDTSPAQIIDAARLADTLAALRDRPASGLDELNEAILSVLCGGNPHPMHLIYKNVMIDERMGRIPDGATMLPLQKDIVKQQAALEMPPTPVITTLVLDLRLERDLQRRIFLHRLTLINIPWGTSNGHFLKPFGRGGLPQQNPGGSLLRRISQPKNPNPEVEGTAKETWSLQWKPEFVLTMIERSLYGSTLHEAATHYTIERIKQTHDLSHLTRLISGVLSADLPAVIDPLLQQIEEAARLSRDPVAMMVAVPPLVNLLRYGDVRSNDGSILQTIADDLMRRTCFWLPNACKNLSDDRASALDEKIKPFHVAVMLRHDEGLITQWQRMLKGLLDAPDVHPLLQGRACRLLFQNGVISGKALCQEMGRHLGTTNKPEQSVFWLKGFLQGESLSFLRDDALWFALSDWVRMLSGSAFTAVLPILRQTFSQFSQAERRAIHERVKQGRTPPEQPLEQIDARRGAEVLPFLRRIGLGGGQENF